jgi:hypothetical protein
MELAPCVALAVGMSALLFDLSGCVQASCNAVCEPQTIITVTDSSTGLPICGASVIATNGGSAVSFSEFQARDGGCRGEYGATLIGDPNAAPWLVQIGAAGHVSGTASVHSLLEGGCQEPGNCAPQSVNITLTMHWGLSLDSTAIA